MPRVMRFTLGTVAEADDPEVRLSLATDADGTVQGFTSWLPVHRDGVPVGWTLDLMRRRDDIRARVERLLAELDSGDRRGRAHSQGNGISPGVS